MKRNMSEQTLNFIFQKQKKTKTFFQFFTKNFIWRYRTDEKHLENGESKKKLEHKKRKERNENEKKKLKEKQSSNRPRTFYNDDKILKTNKWTIMKLDLSPKENKLYKSSPKW